ncbi:hypothetical protein DB30_06510 [Enhygromyxa salina]|uniref:Rhamnogalacturonase A/B/Epimerase-like pectate lyase domain-containing protein n=1 Tax=Enhygromyxa salina TaxID=215803 RepID=A0A0C2CTX9_9BACT|nr:glycosyl hydrolase family 28-related protein [Enhygromyxa salina]KIG14631.1 hypothetical protein DB30_06510 [Enhygromyxa salina]
MRRLAIASLTLLTLGCRADSPGTEAASDGSATTTSESGSSTGDEAETAGTGTETDTGAETETTGTDTDTDEPETWRSSLYPEDWIPGFTDEAGRFLHDFSWAGYHNGEAPIPNAIAGVERSVLEDGADPSGAADSTAAIQATINAVSQAGGGVVLVPAGSYRCDGLLTLTTSGVVIRGAGPDQTFVWFTRDQGITDVDHLTVRGVVSHADELALTTDAQTLDTEVWVAAADNLSVGDDVALGWVITDDFVEDHQMTDTWVSFNGQWRTFFRREVVAIECGDEGCRVSLDVPLRYPALLRDAASLRIETGYLREVGVEDLSVSTVGDWDAAWQNDRSHALALIGVADGWVRRVHSFESPNSSDDRARHLSSGGILVRDAKRVTVADSVMARPQNRGGGGNGYLFEISRGNEILTRDCQAHEGRHNFIQNWDFGTTGCVWLRTHSEGGVAYVSANETISTLGLSEYHHSLALANLVDDSVVHDGWQGANRLGYSSGAGHSATQNVFWNLRGRGEIRSFQYGWGYVIGTMGLAVYRELAEATLLSSLHTEPVDWVEGEDEGATLEPASLYEDQLARRLGR